MFSGASKQGRRIAFLREWYMENRGESPALQRGEKVNPDELPRRILAQIDVLFSNLQVPVFDS